MATRSYARATPPDLRTLATSLVATLGHGRFYAWYQDGVVRVDTEDFSATDAQIQAVVDACAAASVRLDGKAIVEGLPVWLDATLVAIVKLLNTERQQHGRPALTRAAFLQLVKDEIDTA